MQEATEDQAEESSLKANWKYKEAEKSQKGEIRGLAWAA